MHLEHRSIRWSLSTMAALGCLVQSAFAQGVDVRENISYKSGHDLTDYERTRCALDLYVPTGVNDFPVIVWFHGGGLTEGDKAEKTQADISRSLAARGIGVASVNYRLSPKVTFPAYVEDAAASVAWVLDNIEDYGGDARNVFVSGHSAGGYLAAMVGADGHYLAAHGHSLDDLAGLMPISGQMVTHGTVRVERDLPPARPIIDAAAPVFHISDGAPPWLAIAGSEDNPARAEENAYFIAALKSVGHTDATYREFEGRTHGSIVSMIPRKGDPVAQAIVEFVEHHTR